MELVVDSKYIAADIAVALDTQGREHMVVVAKSTWSIPESGQRPRPLPPQPLVKTDEYMGKPGESAMKYGTDFARYKSKCDILFHAYAHAPEDKPVTELISGWRIGNLHKRVRVLGARTWERHIGTYRASEPIYFTSQPLHYGLAFGGTRHYQQNGQALSEAFLSNPNGIGWAGAKTSGDLEGQPMPCLESIDDPITSPRGKHEAVAFSAIGRHWAPRKDYAGTYDEHWRKNDFPLLPKDYSEAFNQCAPVDQQIDYPQGGEPVIMLNMMKGRSDVRFTLPILNQMQVRALRTDYSSQTIQAVVDTLYIEPEEKRFSAVWRVSLPIHRRLQEFDTIAVGPINLRWWADKAAGRNSSSCVGCGSSEEEQAEASA
jgi:hypothetical protein